MIRRLIRKSSAYYHTVKHLSAGQVWHRLKLMTLREFDKRFGKHAWSYYRRRLGPLAAAEPLLVRGQPETFHHQAFDLQRRLERADDLLADTFTFLNETRIASGIELWRCPTASQLWRYQVHYFDYTVDLAVAYLATGRVVYYNKFKELVESWVKHNWPGVPDAWHPYPLSLRVVNWLYACSWFSDALALDNAFRALLEEAIQVQLSYLEDHLEFDVRGNHLLKNAKALVLGALHFTNSARAQQWLTTGVQVLEREAAEQVLPDGGHFERSWLYHLIVLQDYAEAVFFLKIARQTVPVTLTAAVRRMVAYIQATLHPDHDIPLFGDTELVGPERLESVVGFAQAVLSSEQATPACAALNGTPASTPSSPARTNVPPEGLLSFPQTGYFGFRSGSNFLLVDCGDPCPSYLPAHAHADMLSFELSIGGRRFVVDAGTFEYGAGPNRQAFRSTLSHNTLIVNGQEQSEAWGAFRLARRAEVLTARNTLDRDVEAFTGAYHTPVGGFVHQRSILWVRRRYWVVVDQVWGRGSLKGRNQLLLAPDWTLNVMKGTISASSEVATMTIRPVDGATLLVEPGWYAPTFGERYRTNRVILETPLHVNQFTTAYVIAPIGEGTSVTLTTDELQLDDGRSWPLPVKPT
jgi:hypothetical protein